MVLCVLKAECLVITELHPCGGTYYSEYLLLSTRQMHLSRTGLQDLTAYSQPDEKPSLAAYSAREIPGRLQP